MDYQMKDGNYKKILLISINRIGDCLLATCLTHSLRKAYPNSKIDVLVGNQGGYAAFLNNKDINNILLLDKKISVKQYIAFIKKNWRQYDLVINDRCTDRSAIYSFMMGKKRIGIINNNQSSAWLKKLIYNHYVFEKSTDEHRIIRNLRILDPLNIKKYPIVVSHVETTINTKKQFDLPENYIVVHCPSSTPLKQWPIESWHCLVTKLIDAGHFIVLTGSNSDIEKGIVNQVAVNQNASRLINLAGKVNFSQLAQIISKATAFIAPDCGPGHLASAYNIPIFSIFGPIPAKNWAPFPYAHLTDELDFEDRIPVKTISNITVFQSERDCVPCYKKDCAIRQGNYSVCLEDITAQTVFDTIQTQLKLI